MTRPAATHSARAAAGCYRSDAVGMRPRCGEGGVLGTRNGEPAVAMLPVAPGVRPEGGWVRAGRVGKVGRRGGGEGGGGRSGAGRDLG